MRNFLLAGLITLAGGTGMVQGQGSLGTPVLCPTGCEQSGFGQMAKSLLAPLRLATGNLLPPIGAEVVTRNDVARMMADGGYAPAEIVAAKIKLEEAQAKSRRAAVRYLATVNCHYYPEAETGLIAALRCDRNECVRLEAALALGTCHCLTSRIVDALSVSVLGSETDGNPSEISARVRSAAQNALNRCLAHGICVPVPGPQILPPPDWSAPLPAPYEPPPVMVQPTNYGVPMMPDSISPAALEYERNRAESISAYPPNTSLPAGQRTLYHLFLNAIGRDPAQTNRQD
jgi:hypothetical protein